MSALLIAAAMILFGGLATYTIYNLIEGEYPFIYWLAWAIAIGGLLLIITAWRPMRSIFLLWSTTLGVLLVLSFFFGKTEGEYLPAAWVGVGILFANLIVVSSAAVLNSDSLALLLAGFAGVLLLAGFVLRYQDMFYYDASFSAAGSFLVIAAVLAGGLARTPLEHLNEVEIAQFNRTNAAARLALSSYDGALDQAQQYRSRIATDFGAVDGAYMSMTDNYLELAASHYNQAGTLMSAAGEPEAPVSSYSAKLQQAVQERVQHARGALSEARSAINKLNEINALYETLATEWIKSYLWFEVAGYWTSESHDYPAYNVCYYGERLSVRSKGEVRETIISDAADRKQASSASDKAGVDWKYFTVEDYEQLVNQGIVPAAKQRIDSAQDAGYYLCGRSPQSGRYGALGEPEVVLQKRYGTLMREVGAVGASFVGDKRYGRWCTIPADGEAVPVSDGQQPPPDAQWCWYQKPDASTAYYWQRVDDNDSDGLVWIRSHRRCIYCTPQSSWAGRRLVPDTTLSQVNGTEGSSIRGPADQGGGPGSGK